jgi:WD40 repeat protein
MASIPEFNERVEPSTAGSASSAPPISDGDVAPSSGEAPPAIEGYQLITLLGDGGMGTVWRARQWSTGREVALKLLRGSGFLSGRARQRFEYEVRLAAQLNHPNIARVYHSGIYQGVYYYAMELVEGEHLDQWGRHHRPGRAQLLSLFQRICHAVDHAHQQGVIHRDLKPSNILIDSHGEPRVVDFGLAKALSDLDNDDTLTREGSIVGTLRYMAPEQAGGGRGMLSIRCDVFSLGAILFELLTGSPPRELTGSAAQQHRQVAEQAVTRPRAVQPGIDRELEAILLKALAPEPSQRYATAGELADDLYRYQRREPIKARPLTLAYLMRKRVQKHKLAFAVTTAILILAAGSAVAAYFEITHQRNRALRGQRRAAQSLYVSRINLANLQLDQGSHAAARNTLERCAVAPRHWEWHYLRHRADQSQQTLTGLSAPVAAITQRVDQGIAAIDTKGQWKAWFRDGTPMNEIAATPSTSQVMEVAVSDGGRVRTLLTPDKLVILRPWERPQRIRREVPMPSAKHVAVSSGGQRIAIAGVDTLAILRARDGTVRSTVELEQNPKFVAFVGEHRLLLAGDEHQLLIHVDDGEVLWTIGHPRRPKAIAIAAEAPVAAIGSKHLVTLRDLETGQAIRTVQSPSQQVTALALSPSGKRLVMGYKSGVIRLESPEKRNRWQDLSGHGSRVTTLSFGADGRHLWSGDLGGSIKRWAATGRSPMARPVAVDAAAPLLALDYYQSSEGRIIVGDSGGRVFTWSKADQWAPLSPRHSRPVNAVAASPGGDRLATASESGAVWIWSGSPPRRVAKLSDMPGRVRDLAWHPEERFLACEVSSAKQVVVVRLADRRPVASFPGGSAVCFTADGRFLVSGSASGERLIWRRTSDWKCVHQIALNQAVRDLAARPSSRQVAALVGRDHVLVFSGANPVRDQQRLAFSQSYVVNGIRYSPDGRRLITAGEPTIDLWHADTLTRLATVSSARAKDYYDAMLCSQAPGQLIGASMDELTIWTPPKQSSPRR